jgi:hypothetical protein
MNQPLFLALPKGQQKHLLLKFKAILGVTWLQMAQLLKVNRSMLFLYCNDCCKMPFKHLKTLCKKTGCDINNFNGLQLKVMPYCMEKIIAKPKQSEPLAEFLGILAGDGCLVDSEHSTNITCDALLDQDYVLNEVKPMFERLFGVSPKVRILKNEICCRLYSKNLFFKEPL